MTRQMLIGTRRPRWLAAVSDDPDPHTQRRSPDALVAPFETELRYSSRLHRSREATMSRRVTARRNARTALHLAVAAVTAMGIAAIAEQPAAAQAAAPVPQIIPEPAHMTVGSGHFRLTSDARIVASGS